MSSRKELMSKRLKLVNITLRKIEASKKLYNKVNNLDHLAKLIVELINVSNGKSVQTPDNLTIGYSTLLKQGGQYRKVLESSFEKISKLNTTNLSSQKNQNQSLSVFDSTPSNWLAEKSLLQCKISNLNNDVSNLRMRNEQLELALAKIDHQLENGSTDNGSSESDTRKMCHAMAHLLDWLVSSELGVVYDTSNNVIADIYGEVIVNSQYLTPYANWQANGDRHG